MRIAMHVDGPVVRGNERQVIRIASGLAARGHEVAASCRAGGPVQAALDAAGVRTTGVRPGGDADLWNAGRFAAWLRRERPDAVMLTSWKRLFVAAAAARAAGVPRLVLRLGGVHPIDPGLRGARKRFAVARMHHGVVVISGGVRDRLLRAVPSLPASRVAVVFNGIEPPASPPAALHAELRIPAGALVALAVGGAEAVKGFDLLVEAAPAAGPGLHLVLAGGGPPDRQAALLRRADALGMGGRVHLLPWHPDVPSLLAASDLFVLSSRSEGMSVAMLEAMAMGCPVLAAEVGGVREALLPREGRGPAGWVVPAGDAAALGGGLAELSAALRAGAPEVAARVAEARWRIAHWFTTERMIDGYLAALRGEPA